MDKRSFNLLFVLVAASMVVMGTYKVVKKKNSVTSAANQLIGKIRK